MTEHSLIQIQEVVKIHPNDPELLWGFNIDTPNTSYKTDKYEVLFAGWILSKKTQVVSIEVICCGRVIQTIPVNYPRPDVAKTYTEASHADTSGFLAQVGVSELSTEVELHLQAVFSDQSRLPIGIVKFQKKLPLLEQVKADLERSRIEKLQLAGGMNLLENELTKYGHWMYEFDLGNGIKTPVYTDVINQVHKVRHLMIFSFLDSVSFDYKSASVLDIACNEGYFAFEELKRGCKFALGLDVRKENIEKALFIQRALQYKNCEFREADIFEFETRDTYELVFLLGIIYHVENPIGLLRKAADLTSKFLIVETQLCQSQQKPISFGWGVPEKYLEGEEYFVCYDEQQETNPLASIGNVFSLIPNLSAVIKILRKLGFKSVIQLYPNNQIQEFQYNKVDRAVLVGIK